MVRSYAVCKFRINTKVAFSSMANLVFSFLMTINMSFSKTNKCQQQKKFSLFCAFWTNRTLISLLIDKLFSLIEISIVHHWLTRG